MLDDSRIQEVIQMKKNLQEKAILGQLASLLVQEKLINPEEQMRFLSYLEEDD